MNQETFLFFSKKSGVLSLWEFFEENVLPGIENVAVIVQKPQIFGGKEIAYEQNQPGYF